MINLRIIHHVITYLTIGGGVLFTAGSIVYLPTLASSVNPSVGGILFIIGSIFFFLCDILGALAQPQFSPLKPFDNIGALRALMIMVGNISFIVGSIFFLPSLPTIVGDDIFIIASIFIIVPQLLTCFGLYSHAGYNQKFFTRLQRIKNHVLYSSILISVACLMFLVGTFEFKDENSQSIGLYTEGVALFITGSLIFLLVAIIGAYLRHKQLQQNEDIHMILEATSIRP